MRAAIRHDVPVGFQYHEAFSRNRGLITPAEQARLREARVVIAGAGGVGGGHALTLARQGIGRFRIADPDTFSVANFNRQAGARISSLGRNKAEEIADQLVEINPEVEVEVFADAIGPHNIDDFLDGADVVIDGVDFFCLAARRLLFERARARGKWVLTAGPLGFSYAFLAFDPRGMSLDQYCGFEDGMSEAEQAIAFLVALAPWPTHLGYMDLGAVDLAQRIGPSSVVACQMCSAVVAIEAMALILGRRRPRAAPAYAQFDVYRGVLRRGRVWLGGRNPLQALKRRLVRRRLRALGVIS